MTKPRNEGGNRNTQMSCVMTIFRPFGVCLVKPYPQDNVGYLWGIKEILVMKPLLLICLCDQFFLLRALIAYQVWCKPTQARKSRQRDEGNLDFIFGRHPLGATSNKLPKRTLDHQVLLKGIVSIIHDHKQTKSIKISSLLSLCLQSNSAKIRRKQM